MKSKNVLSAMAILAFLTFANCRSQGDATSVPVTTIITSPPINTATPVKEIPSASSLPAQTPKLGLIPTFSPEDALETFINLIEEDDDCNLPCWLKVRPGQTKFEIVNNNFSQFSAIAAIELSPQSAYIRVFFPNFETANHSTATEVYYGSGGEVSHVLVNAGVHPDANGYIAYSNPEFQRVWHRYFIPGVFSRYGIPDRIFLDTTRIAADPSTNYPYALWTVYEQEGFLIRYQGDNIKVGDKIKICPMQSRIEIKIWDVEKSSYVQFLSGDEAGGISLGPQPIEDVTSFDIESFYATFKEGQLNTCFETPASLWPPN